jgi:hypothetical protein
MYSENGSSVLINQIFDRSSELSNVLVRNKTHVVDGVSKKESTYYVYGAGLNYEVTFNSDGTEAEVKSYHYDQVGSTVALTNGEGTITDRFSYDKRKWYC